MSGPVILASGSEIRRALLANAGVPFTVETARIDEETIRASLEAEGAGPRDVADTLAEYKARRVGDRRPDALVIGCDQVLELKGQVLAKPADQPQARDQLRALRGNQHRLISAVVVWHAGRPLWRHVGIARLTMREFSDAYLEEYLARNWHSIRHSVGCYKLEEEGVRLFTAVEGDYFTVLGLPLLALLSFLTSYGTLPA